MAKQKLSSFVAWYSNPENRKRLNKKRKLRYHTDKKYRAQQLQNTRRWREAHPPVRVEAVKTHLSMGELAEFCNCNQKTLRNLEAWGELPDMSNHGKHRRYTKAQAKLVNQVVSFRKSHHYREKTFKEKLKAVVNNVFERW